jgi:hypothetical protein
MPSDVRPYLVPSPDTVIFGAWTHWDGEDWSPLPEAIDGWDPGTDLRLRREVRIDVERLRRETGLGGTSEMALTMSWTSSSSGMTEASDPVVVRQAGVLLTEVVLLGARVGGVVRLRTTLSVTSVAQAGVPGVVWMPGSVLAEDERRLALEGSLSMFPVHDVDFSHTRLSPDASWHLEAGTELTAPFLGSFRLLLNSRDKELMAAVSRGVKDKRQQALCDELEQGVAAVMLELAVLVRDELIDREEWPPETVGDVLSRTLAAAEQTAELRAPTGAHEVVEFRTRLAGAVRGVGHGRAFR